jgi:hypothetical protein
MRRLLIVATVSLLGAGAADAQSIDEYVGYFKCIGGNALPTCERYIVFDAIVARQIGGTMKNREGSDSNGDLTQLSTSIYTGWEIGAMWNRGFHNALGGTVEFDFVDGGHGRLAVKGRARRWITPQQTLDVSIGGMGQTVFQPNWVNVECGTCTESAYGITADATYGYRLLGITVGADVVRGYGKTMTSLRAGGRAGGIAGVAATLIAATVMGAAVGAM